MPINNSIVESRKIGANQVALIPGIFNLSINFHYLKTRYKVKAVPMKTVNLVDLSRHFRTYPKTVQSRFRVS